METIEGTYREVLEKAKANKYRKVKLKVTPDLILGIAETFVTLNRDEFEKYVLKKHFSDNMTNLTLDTLNTNFNEFVKKLWIGLDFEKETINSMPENTNLQLIYKIINKTSEEEIAEDLADIISLSVANQFRQKPLFSLRQLDKIIHSLLYKKTDSVIKKEILQKIKESAQEPEKYLKKIKKYALDETMNVIDALNRTSKHNSLNPEITKKVIDVLDRAIDHLSRHSKEFEEIYEEAYRERIKRFYYLETLNLIVMTNRLAKELSSSTIDEIFNSMYESLIKSDRYYDSTWYPSELEYRSTIELITQYLQIVHEGKTDEQTIKHVLSTLRYIQKEEDPNTELLTYLSEIPYITKSSKEKDIINKAVKTINAVKERAGPETINFFRLTQLLLKKNIFENTILQSYEKIRNAATQPSFTYYKASIAHEYKELAAKVIKKYYPFLIKEIIKEELYYSNGINILNSIKRIMQQSEKTREHIHAEYKKGEKEKYIQNYLALSLIRNPDHTLQELKNYREKNPIIKYLLYKKKRFLS